MSRELEGPQIINKQKLALAAVFSTVRASVPTPAPGPILQLSESGAVTTNKGREVRAAKPAQKAEGK